MNKFFVHKNSFEVTKAFVNIVFYANFVQITMPLGLPFKKFTFLYN